MNLLGITWGMGAKDVGMEDAVTSAQSNIQRLNRDMEAQSKIAEKSKVPGFWESVKQFNIASIASSMRELTGDTGNLSNALESMAVANAKAAKPFVAAMNLSGKEARKMTSRISSMAISMNVGAETVAETFKSIQQATGPAKDALDALGYSEKDWVKIAETTGIKVADLTDVMGGMGALWKAAPADEAKFINRLVDIGKQAGLGLTPMKNLKQNIEGLSKPFEKLPPELQRSGDEMMALAESATRMGGVFRELGSSEEEATNLGMQTAQMFADQAVAIEQATKYGIGSLDDSPLFKYLTSLGIGMDDAINIIETGSRDSVKGMQMIQGAFAQFGVGGAQQQAMLAQLSGALGESAAGLGYLAQNTDAGGKALERMSKITSDGKFSLKDYANEAFSTGRTLQESLDLMKQSFETRFRSIARKDVVNFVGEMGKAYGTIGDKAQEMASDSTWGPLIKRLSAVNQLGAKGLFLNFGGSNEGMAKFAAIADVGGGALQSLATSFGPVVSMLGSLTMVLGPVMGLFGGLIGKLGIVGLVIGGVAAGLKLLSGRGIDLTGVFTSVLKWVSGLAGKVRDFLKGIDWASVGKTLGGFIWDMLTFIPKTIWNWLTGKESKSEMGQAAEGLASNLGGAIFEAIKGLGSMLWNLGGEIIDGISEWWDSWTWDDVKEGFLNMGDNIKQWWADLQKDPEFGLFELDVEESLSNTAWDVQNWWYDLTTSLESITPEEASQAGASLVSKINDGIDAAAEASESAKNASQKFLDDAVAGVENFDPTVVDTSWATHTTHWINTITGFFTGAGEQIQKEADGTLFSFFTNVGDSVWNYIKGIGYKIYNGIQKFGVGMAQIVYDFTHPAEAEARWKAEQAKDAKEQVVRLQQQIAQQKEFIARRAKLVEELYQQNRKMASEGLTAFGLGQEVEGKKKTKKQLDRERQFMEGTGKQSWAAQSQRVADAARNLGEAQYALAVAQAEQKKLGEGGTVEQQKAAQSAVTKAQQMVEGQTAQLKEIQTGAKTGALAQAMQGAGVKAGSAEAEGIKKALEAVATAEAERAKGKQDLLDAQTKLTDMQTQLAGYVNAATTAVTAAFGDVAGQTYQAGYDTLDDYKKGLENQEALDALKAASQGAAQVVSDNLVPHSPIPEGPLEGVGKGGPGDPAYDAGMTLMENFAAGIDTGAGIVADAITSMLNESVFATIDAAQIEMQRAMEKKGLLNEVAASLMNQFGATIQETVTVDDKTQNVKQTMKAMLSVPGLAGVTMAIINESAKQLGVLDKIRIATEKVASTVGTAKAGGPGIVLAG